MWRSHAHKKEDQSDWDSADKAFALKLLMIQNWCQGFSSSRTKRKAPWKETAENAILTQCTSGYFKWLESSVKVVPMPSHKAKGGYGTVRKVRLTKLSSIPMWMEFARKSLKEPDERNKCWAIVNEAGRCLVKHPGIIRLSFLHPITMEGYSLWWNGGSLHSFLAHFNKEVSESISHNDIVKLTDTKLNLEQLGWIARYGKNRVNLALSLLVIVGKCHNDLFPSNVLLHFDPWKENTMYLGICDWGLSSRVVEKEPSKYGYDTMEELQHVKNIKKFVAPELFYKYGAAGSENSIEAMQKQHLYSMEADTYAAGWIVERIWNQEWDSQYFTKQNPEQFLNLELKLKSLQKEDVKERSTVVGVLDTLKQTPYC